MLSAILERFQTSAGRLLQQHVKLVLLGHIHLPRVHQSANSAMLESMLGRDGRLPARRVGQERLLLCPQQPVSIVRLERTLLRHQLRAEIVWRASTHRRPHPALAHRAMQANTPSCWGQPCLRNVKRVILGRLRNCRHPDARLVPQESTQSRVLVLCCADLATQASIRTRWVQAHPAYASRATLGPTRRHHRPSAHSVRRESTPEQVPILVPAALLESSRPPGEQHPQAHVQIVPLA